MASSQSFGNNFARYVVIFAIDNSSSVQNDNHENNILVLVEGTTDDINDSVGTAETKFSNNFF